MPISIRLAGHFDGVPHQNLVLCKVSLLIFIAPPPSLPLEGGAISPWEETVPFPRRGVGWGKIAQKISLQCTSTVGNFRLR